MKKQNSKLADVRQALSGKKISTANSKSIQGGIVGGQTATPHEFPWQVSI
jgi:hypothetical protein